MKAICLLAAILLAAAAPAFAQTRPGEISIPAYQKKPASGKIKSYATRTVDALHGLPGPDAPRDAYGGLLARTEAATGYFRTQQIEGRWWLIDPDGHPYIDAGMVAVAPQHGPTFKAAFNERFGSAEKWRDETVSLLSGARFTGTGAWSKDNLMQSRAQRVPYMPLVAFMAGYGKKRGGMYQQSGHFGFPNDAIFVFDPGFETFADTLAKTLADKKDDPWLVGYMSDNELPFSSALLTKFRALPAGDPGRIAADAWFAARHSDPAAKPTAEDLEAFRGYVADRYFGIVSRAIRKYDPHHLYMGSRCNSSERNSAEFMRNAGRHVDVMSLNVYGLWSPGQEVGKWSAACGKPILVTEFYAKGNDSGMANSTGAGWTVPTQADRGAFYQNFTLELLQSKTCVGWTWFKYADNDPLDLTTDPSNRDSNKGIVNDKYVPYEPLLRAMTKINSRVYGLADYFDRLAGR